MSEIDKLLEETYTDENEISRLQRKVNRTIAVEMYRRIILGLLIPAVIISAVWFSNRAVQDNKQLASVTAGTDYRSWLL